MIKKSKEVGTLELLMSVLKVNSKSMRSILAVKRKVFNIYKKRSDERLPKEVKEVLIKVFSVPNMEKLRQYIERAKECKITNKEAKERFREYLIRDNNCLFDAEKLKVRNIDIIIQEHQIRNNLNRRR